MTKLPGSCLAGRPSLSPTQALQLLPPLLPPPVPAVVAPAVVVPIQAAMLRVVSAVCNPAMTAPGWVPLLVASDVATRAAAPSAVSGLGHQPPGETDQPQLYQPCNLQLSACTWAVHMASYCWLPSRVQKVRNDERMDMNGVGQDSFTQSSFDNSCGQTAV